MDKEFLDYLKAFPEGVTDPQVREFFGKRHERLAGVVNDLLRQRRIELFQTGVDVVYRFVSDDVVAKTADLSQEEMIVLQHISEAGNSGSWLRNLRLATGLQTQQLNKVIKRLESKRLIKNVKSVAHPKQRTYMLYDLEPSKEITGGAWYTEQELDQAFIESLRKFVFDLLRRQPMTCNAVTEHVASAGVSHVSLDQTEIQQILDTLIFDRKIEFIRTVRSEDGRRPEPLYRIARSVATYDRLTEVPCGICPVAHQCFPGGKISPETCEYMDKWLDF